MNPCDTTLRPHHQSIRELCRSCPSTLQHHPSPHLTFSVCFNYFINFNWRTITLQYCGGFCRTSTWISHRCTRVPPSWTPLHLPPHPIPLGCTRAPVWGALLHASNLHWSSILHMVIHVSMPTCLLKTLCWNPLGSSGLFRHEPPVSLQDPAVNLSRLQTPRFQFVWPHCVSGARTCVSTPSPNFSRI